MISNTMKLVNKLTSTIDWIESRNTENEYESLQEILNTDLDLLETTKRVIEFKEKIKKRLKEESYRIHITLYDHSSLSIPLSQNKTVKELVEELEKENESDISSVKIDFITREWNE